MAHTDPHGAPHGESAGHESTDANVGGVEKFLIATGIFLVVAFGIVWLLFNVFERREAALDVAPSPVVPRQGDRLPPAPRLQRLPYDDLAAFRAAEQAELDRWEWVDKEQGIARIPVSRAIEIAGEHGLRPAAPEMPGAAGEASEPSGGAATGAAAAPPGQ